MKPLIGFLPDADPTAAGAIMDCANIIPFDAGFEGAPTPVAASVPALAAECRGAAVLTKLDGTRRAFAGSQAKLYELTGAAWTDRSAGAGSYTGSTESRWSFAQFGDTSIASNLVDAMQSSASGAFAAIAGAPKAQIVVSASNNFVIAFHTNEGTYGDAPDRWWNCAQSDQTTWTPSVATGATTGRLVAAEGPITAALPLGDYVIAYKRKGLFVGQFVGSASGTWAWPRVRGGECGCVGQDAVCDIGGAHFIVGEDDFWIFDGTAPQSIGAGVRNWFRKNVSQTYRYRTKVSYDRERNLVWVNYPSQQSTGQTDRTLVFHIGRKQWGIADFTAEALLAYVAPGVTIDGLTAYSSTIDGLPPIPFDSQYWLSGGRSFSYFNTAHQIVVNNGASAASWWQSSEVGDDDAVTTLSRARIRWILEPSAATSTGLSKMSSGKVAVPMAGAEPMQEDSSFMVWQEARWHSVRFDMTGPHQESAYDIGLQPDAQR